MWDQRYAEPAFAYGKEPNDFLASLDLGGLSTRQNRKGTVLCIAEGQGRNAVYLAQNGFVVTAMDQSETGLARARELAREKNVSIETICADLNSFDLGLEKWDGIVSIFGHLPSALRKKVHASIVKALKPGGFFAMEGYNKSQLGRNTGGPQDINMLYDLNEFLEETGPEMDWQILRNDERIVSEGTYHTGLASVLQAFGVKKS